MQKCIFSCLLAASLMHSNSSNQVLLERSVKLMAIFTAVPPQRDGREINQHFISRHTQTKKISLFYFLKRKNV